jgi:hypothetical protein
MSINVGVYVDGRNPRSKKEIKDRIANGDLEAIEIYSTSRLGPAFRGGSLDEVSDGDYLFCGPDPYATRTFYGTISKRNGRIKVS